MSHHHMLPPIIYTPQPKPKKIDNRKSRAQLRAAGDIRYATSVGEAEETGEPGSPSPLTSKPPLHAQMPIEDAGQKPPSTCGFLSEGTLKALLTAQEVAK